MNNHYYTVETAAGEQFNTVMTGFADDRGRPGPVIPSQFDPAVKYLAATGESSRQKFGDCVTTGMALVVSNRAYQIIREFCRNEDIHWIPTRLCGKKGMPIASDYWYALARTTYDILNEEKSVCEYFVSTRVVFHVKAWNVFAGKIPNTGLFAEKRREWIVSEGLRSAIIHAELTNFKFGEVAITY